VPSPRRSTRRRLRRFPIVLVLLIAALLIANRLPMLGSPLLQLKVFSESLQFDLQEDYDLIGRSHEGSRLGATGIRLGTPWVYLRAVEVVVIGDVERTLKVSADRALDVLELQKLEIGERCAVHISTSIDGLVRLQVSPSVPRDTTCRVHGSARLGSSSNLPDSLRFAKLLDSVPPHTSVEIIARPSVSQPAVLQFHPREVLQVSRIRLSRLSFETRDRSQDPQSSIVGGTIEFPHLHRPAKRLGGGDTLHLDRPRGEITQLSIGDTLRSEFAGKASGARIASRSSLKPTLLDQMRSSALLIAFGATVTVLAALSDLAGRRK
jgi:hypothetical protein